MTPRERLTEILNLNTVDFLEKKGFRFYDTKSQFKRTLNQIKQIIYFEGSKWNYSDAVADYALYCRIEIPTFPKWYLENYLTDQSPHHQVKVSEKSIRPPSLSKGYRDNWDEYAQLHRKYDLLKYTSLEVAENIHKNVVNAIIPYLDHCSSYAGIAEYAVNPLDSFDFYMMDDKKDDAKKKLLEMKSKIEALDSSQIDVTDDFIRRSIENTILMTNIRINRFFPDLEEVNKQLLP